MMSYDHHLETVKKTKTVVGLCYPWYNSQLCANFHQISHIFLWKANKNTSLKPPTSWDGGKKMSVDLCYLWVYQQALWNVSSNSVHPFSCEKQKYIHERIWHIDSKKLRNSLFQLLWSIRGKVQKSHLSKYCVKNFNSIYMQ